jgi:hypothetical protein
VTVGIHLLPFTWEGSGLDGKESLPSLQAARMRVWLQGLRVLAKQRKAPRAEERADGATGSDSDEDRGPGAGQWNEPCPLCGRTYFHVHKRSVRQGGEGAGDDDF